MKLGGSFCVNDKLIRDQSICYIRGLNILKESKSTSHPAFGRIHERKQKFISNFNLKVLN